ncbi:DUF5694 domain-containing protein [Chryseobacterium taiwanense]|uniref:Haem-binding uptake Tiki superfamily ChaN domain-containing protein n=1 Tax=Chryseobacterium taiwanense TaxID=363331 RepID=A0A0B4DDG7_9FLAO|nr:DUF5694 domain-containing protein [Chryseobacterium taiwanense]KIC62375.1 hypothetical protein RM51_12640 [Chryseobacterium taiwanense]
MKKIFYLVLILLFSLGFSQQKINVILIGTNHFNNPGHDAGKPVEIKILENHRQEGLERITNKIIQKYKPQKVFVEYPSDQQKTLDKFYNLYKNNQAYYQSDTLTKEWQKRFYKENEIFQFGFRLAKKSANQKIYALDYESPMRFDLFTQKAKEISTVNPTAFDDSVKKLTEKTNKCITQKEMEDVYKCLNSAEDLRFNKSIYINTFNRLNKEPDFYGSDLVAAWYKRNLIMFSAVQNAVSDNDKNIVILVGQGHAAMMEEFIRLDSRFNLVTVEEIF